MAPFSGPAQGCWAGHGLPGPWGEEGHGTAENTSQWVKSDGERGTGCSCHLGVPSLILEMVVVRLLEKPRFPPPWGDFLSRRRERECNDYPNNINSFFSMYSLLTGDPSMQTCARFIWCMGCPFLFFFFFLTFTFFPTWVSLLPFAGLLPVENSSLCHDWLHCTLQFPSKTCL